MTDTVAELRNVGFTYSAGGISVEALQEVSVSLLARQSLALVGVSGSGKSTLLGLLALLRRPSQGTIRLLGQDLSRLSDRELAALRGRRIGLVFQDFRLDPRATALDNVLLPWTFHATTTYTEAVRHGYALMEQLDIADLARRPVSRMSGGQRQRVAIARALHLRPCLLLADEPTGNLDYETGLGVRRILCDLPALASTSVVIATHDAEFANQTSRCLRMHDGRVVEGH